MSTDRIQYPINCLTFFFSFWIQIIWLQIWWVLVILSLAENIGGFFVCFYDKGYNKLLMTNQIVMIVIKALSDFSYDHIFWFSYYKLSVPLFESIFYAHRPVHFIDWSLHFAFVVASNFIEFYVDTNNWLHFHQYQYRNSIA